MKIINKILYFILTVVALGSMGVWLPFAIDYFKGYSLNKETTWRDTKVDPFDSLGGKMLKE